MIWSWLGWFLGAVGRLLIPPMSKESKGLRVKIDPNTSCPACHGTKGRIRFMSTVRVLGNTTVTPMVVHNCSICGCSWGEPPLSVPLYPVDLTTNGLD